MANRDVELIGHLMRRAGFGATRDQLDAYAARGYEATVEMLLDQTSERRMGDDLIRRFHPELSGMMGTLGSGENWLYRMATTTTPLREKVALFWHGIFATGYPKVIHGKALSDQVRMFRYKGMASFRDLLVELSKDPAMIIWLDNQDNHKDAINENFGRELLELFSMGVGNYTERTCKECARAFTGWTLGNREYMELRSMRDSDWPYGRISWHFEFQEDDHDFGDKEFLGQRGQVQRRRHRGHHLPAGGHRPVHRAAHVQLLRGRRAAGSRVALHRAAGPGGHRPAGAGLLRQRLRHHRHAAGAVQLRSL